MNAGYVPDPAFMMSPQRILLLIYIFKINAKI